MWINFEKNGTPPPDLHRYFSIELFALNKRTFISIAFKYTLNIHTCI